MIRSLAFANEGFFLSVACAADAEDVRRVLRDPRALLALHPLVIGVDREPGRPDVFVVTDRLELGAAGKKLRSILGWGEPGGPEASFRTQYRARLEATEDGVKGEAWAALGTHLQTRYRCIPTPDGCRVDEDATVSALRPLLAFTVKTARAAHEVMLGRLAARFDRVSEIRTQPRGSGAPR